MNFKNSCNCLSKQIYISCRSFGSSSVNASWIDKIRPIYPKGHEEKTAREKYFEHFKSKKGFSPDVLNTLDKRAMNLSDYFTIKGVQKVYQHFKLRAKLFDQRYIDERVEHLGFDLAAAHFLVSRGGKIRFKGQTSWIEKNEDDEYDLPRFYDPTYLIEEINISKLEIIYDGLMNLEGLSQLKTLNMSHCPFIDDWCMDRICGQFCNSLEELDLSHCSLITEKGFETVGRLRFLKHLKADGFDKLPNIKLISILLEDATPGLKIEGISLS